MKLMLDTNVLIAAFISRGVCCDLFEHCAREHELITSEFILNEFREHLCDKFKINAEHVEKATDLLRSKLKIVHPAPLLAPICRDPDDDMILATAIAGNAACIVTGDKDLLVLKEFEKIKIVSPSEFVEYEAETST